MFGINAQARNTPGGIYDRFAELMGILATAPNQRRQLENRRAEHTENLDQRKLESGRDYELKKQYYDMLMAKPPAGQAADRNMAMRQAIQQNPMPVDDILRDEYGDIVTGTSDKPTMVPAGSPNYLAAVEGRDPVMMPDIREQLRAEALAKQGSAYNEAVGIPWRTPDGVAKLQAQGVNPYEEAVTGTTQMATTPAPAPVPTQGVTAPVTSGFDSFAKTVKPPIDPIALDAKLRALSAADHAAYQRILATGDPMRVQGAHEAIMGAVSGAP